MTGIAATEKGETMADCKACGNWFSSSDPKDEICYHCKNAIKRMNGYAVPVVRCRDCRSYNTTNPLDAFGKCAYFGASFVYGDDFCSHGERREENAAD